MADKNHYSVPYEYIQHQVDVRITSKTVEVFYHHLRIASHVRNRHQENQYITVPEHMPEKHQRYLNMSSESFRKWASSVGPNTTIVMNAILTRHPVEKQSFRTCTALMKLADKYSLTRLEEACQRGLSYTPSPSYKTIQTILKTGQDKLKTEAPKNVTTGKGFGRGADYFGGDLS